MHPYILQQGGTLEHILRSSGRQGVFDLNAPLNGIEGGLIRQRFAGVLHNDPWPII